METFEMCVEPQLHRVKPVYKVHSSKSENVSFL